MDNYVPNDLVLTSGNRLKNIPFSFSNGESFCTRGQVNRSKRTGNIWTSSPARIVYESSQPNRNSIKSVHGGRVESITSVKSSREWCSWGLHNRWKGGDWQRQILMRSPQLMSLEGSEFVGIWTMNICSASHNNSPNIKGISQGPISRPILLTWSLLN